MFHIDDRTAYIKSLQRMLSIPTTGRMNDGMRTKISNLQQEHGYPASGTVDYSTHNLIRAQYHEKIKKAALKEPIEPYRIGDDIIGINRELSLLIGLYGLELRSPRGRAYGFDSIRAVEFLRKLYRLPSGDKIDYELYDRMKRDVLSMSANNKDAGIG